MRRFLWWVTKEVLMGKWARSLLHLLLNTLDGHSLFGLGKLLFLNHCTVDIRTFWGVPLQMYTRCLRKNIKRKTWNARDRTMINYVDRECHHVSRRHTEISFDLNNGNKVSVYILATVQHFTIFSLYFPCYHDVPCNKEICRRVWTSSRLLFLSKYLCMYVK